MKYKQRIFIALAFAAVCCALIFLAPAVTDIQYGETVISPQSHRKSLGDVHFGKRGGKASRSRGSFGAHLNFMRKDLDLSNYTGDNNNSPELGYSDLFGSKQKQLGDRKSENVIKEFGDDEDGDNGLFNNPKNSKENRILSYLKEILMDDDTFLEEGNLENLIYLADLIKHSAKSNAHHVLTKKDILEELADKLQSEGVIIPKLAIPTEVPVIAKNVVITHEEWSALNKARPSMFSGQKKRRRGRGPSLNIYPRPRK